MWKTAENLSSFTCVGCGKEHQLEPEGEEVRAGVLVEYAACPDCGRRLYRVLGALSGGSTAASDGDEASEPSAPDGPPEERVGIASAFAGVLLEFLLGLKRVVKGFFELIALPFTAPVERIRTGTERIRLEEERRAFEAERSRWEQAQKETMRKYEENLRLLEQRVGQLAAVVEDVSSALNIDSLYKRLEEEVQRRNEALIGISEVVSDTMIRVDSAVEYLVETLKQVEALSEELRVKLEEPSETIAKTVTDEVLREVPVRLMEVLRDDIRSEVRKAAIQVDVAAPNIPMTKVSGIAGIDGVRAEHQRLLEEGNLPRLLIFGDPNNPELRFELDLGHPDVHPRPEDWDRFVVAGSSIGLRGGGPEFRQGIEELLKKEEALRLSAHKVGAHRFLGAVDEEGRQWEIRVTLQGNIKVLDKRDGNLNKPLSVLVYRAFLKAMEERGIDTSFSEDESCFREKIKKKGKKKAAEAEAV